MGNMTKPLGGWKLRDLDNEVQSAIENAGGEVDLDGFALLEEDNVFEGGNYFQYPIRFGTPGGGNAMTLGIEANKFILRDYNEVVMVELGDSVAALAPDNEGTGVQILKLGTANIVIRDSSVSPSFISFGVGFEELQIKSTSLSFFGGTPVEQPILSGSTDSEKLDSVIDALIALNLIGTGGI